MPWCAGRRAAGLTAAPTSPLREHHRRRDEHILGADQPYTPVPYFWTDQFSAKIHVHGFAGPDVSIVEGSVAEGRFVAGYHRDGELTGVLGWNMPKQARQHRAGISLRGPATVATSTPGAA